MTRGIRKEFEIDHYEVLGLPSEEEGAKLTEKEITKAYKSKALELHPDKRPNNPDAHSEFQRLTASYEVLKDENARRSFDYLLRKRREERLRNSQYDSKRRKRMFDHEEREKATSTPDPAKTEEERIAKKLQEEIARVRAMRAKHTVPAAKVLKVSWESGGDDYGVERLKELCGNFGAVKDIVMRSKGTKKRRSALVVMTYTDAAFAAMRKEFGDLPNPLSVLPLNLPLPLPRDGFAFVSKKKRDGLASNNHVGAGFQAYENSTLDKLQKAAQNRK